MSGDIVGGMILILLFTFAGGVGMGSYLLKFTDRKALKYRADLTGAFFVVAMVVAFIAAHYLAAEVALGLSVFFAGMGAADSPPEEAR